jgi:5,10-methylenetetrahydromethanopterin reductase
MSLRLACLLLPGETVEVDGALCRLIPSAGSMPPFPMAVPIFLAASGPRGRQVAQEVVDGVIMPSLFVTGGFDPCIVTAFGTVLDEAEGIDSPRVRAAAGPGVALIYHTTYEARGAVDALPNGCAWRESIERIPKETRHLALHCGHGVEMNEHDRAHVPMTDAKRLTFTGTPRELRVRLADLEARGATEIVFGGAGPDISRELRAFAALMQGP